MIVRKRAEAAAEQSRSRLVEAQRIARVGSWENDLRSRVSVWSDEQFHILGYRPGEIEPHIDIRSDEHTSELQSLMRIPYAVFCLKKKILRTKTQKPAKITASTK